MEGDLEEEKILPHVRQAMGPIKKALGGPIKDKKIRRQLEATIDDLQQLMGMLIDQCLSNDQYDTLQEKFDLNEELTALREELHKLPKSDKKNKKKEKEEEENSCDDLFGEIQYKPSEYQAPTDQAPEIPTPLTLSSSDWQTPTFTKTSSRERKVTLTRDELFSDDDQEEGNEREDYLKEFPGEEGNEEYEEFVIDPVNIPEEEFNCSICFEDTMAIEGYKYSICGHTFCKTCVNEYYLTALGENRLVGMTCPYLDCEVEVEEYDVLGILSDEDFEKYEAYYTLETLKADPTARWCPNPDCESVLVGENVSGSSCITCPTCTHDFCYDCSQIWHEGITCQEYKVSIQDDDEKTKKWKRKHGVKNCPYCGLETIKVSGCPDMKCVNCKKTWEWFENDSKWEPGGIRRKDETKLESLAFIYPRFCAQMIGSREYDEEDVSGKSVYVTLGFLGLAGVPLTIICGIPALAIKSGRGLKRKIRKKKTLPNNEKEDKEEP